MFLAVFFYLTPCPKPTPYSVESSYIHLIKQNSNSDNIHHETIWCKEHNSWCSVPSGNGKRSFFFLWTCISEVKHRPPLSQQLPWKADGISRIEYSWLQRWHMGQCQDDHLHGICRWWSTTSWGRNNENNIHFIIIWISKQTPGGS